MLLKEKTHKRSTLRVFLWLPLLVFVAPDGAMGSSISPIWTYLYKELNDGASPPWKGRDEARAWGVREKERLEPVILEILRGKRVDADWSGSVLFVARVISTEEIRDVLLERVQEVVAKADGNPMEARSRDVGAVALSIDIFARAKDARIVPTVLELIAVEDQAQEVVRRCADALRNLGNGEDSIAALRGIALRKKDVYMDRRCAMAKKVIQARIRGIDLCRDAQQELRALARRFAAAVDRRDFQAYIFTWMFRFRERLDEDYVMREHFGDPDFLESVQTLGRTLDSGKPFDVDLENLKASLDCGDRYRLECVLEVDGWKVMNMRPLPPAQLRRDVLPQTNAKKKAAKRIIIGIPAKDRERP